MDSKLTTDLLISAYSHGYFPMPHPDTEEICWFHPDRRAIMPLDGFHVSRSLARTIRHAHYRWSFDQDFAGVMAGCADRPETWINAEMKQAYSGLFQNGFAHSVEVWRGEALIGGSYGVSIGGAFFAESMFHRETDASKLALYHLVKALNALGYTLLEVQFLTPHLRSLGAIELSAAEYMVKLQAALALNPGKLTSL